LEESGRSDQRFEDPFRRKDRLLAKENGMLKGMAGMIAKYKTLFLEESTLILKAK